MCPPGLLRKESDKRIEVNLYMIRVLHVADKLTVGDSTFHGVTQLFSWWIPRFDKSRYNVSVCSLRKRDKAGEYLEKLGIKVFYLNKWKFDPFTLSSLLSLIKNERIDILHLHGYGSWTFGRIAGLFSRTPIVVHEHMVDRNIPIYQRIVDHMLSGTTTRGIAVSDAVKDFMVNCRGLRRDRVKVAENGIPLESFLLNAGKKPPNETATEWLAKLRIPLNHKIVGAIGRLNPVKGYNYYLEAAKKVLREYSQVRFLIVGDGELRQSLEKMARRLGIARHVEFTGHCEDVAPLLSIMDIMVIASLSEGGPITLFEAMASGCAVISTNTIGLKHKIKDGQTGFLVPPENSNAIARKLLQLLKDSDLCKAMGGRAKEVSHQYDIRNTVRQLEECYEEVLRQR